MASQDWKGIKRWKNKWCSVVKMESRRRNTSARKGPVQQRFVAPEGAVFCTTPPLCIDKGNRGLRCTFVKIPPWHAPLKLLRYRFLMNISRGCYCLWLKTMQLTPAVFVRSLNIRDDSWETPIQPLKNVSLHHSITWLFIFYNKTIVEIKAHP
jgi:hypothetical protein